MPECALTGYCFPDEEAAHAAAIEFSANEPNLARLRKAVDDVNVVLIVGFAEREGDVLYNSVAVFESGKEPRRYRKLHLPCLGYDRYAATGSEVGLFDTQFGKIGVMICFDMRPPELARVLTLCGADILAIPTNWPVGAETSAEHVCITRAAENHVYVVTANRVGTEGDFTFIGRSKIISPEGKVVEAAGAESGTIVAELDLNESRNKRRVVIPDAYEMEIIGCRRPELYGPICAPKA